VHRGQSGLRRRDIRIIPIDLLGTGGEQPDGPASWTDERGVIGQARIGPAGDLLNCGGSIELVEWRRN
jgi:hypothetical protein